MTHMLTTTARAPIASSPMPAMRWASGKEVNERPAPGARRIEFPARDTWRAEVAECRLIDENEPAADDLESGQRQLRAFEERVAKVKDLTGAPFVTLRDIGEFCLREVASGLAAGVVTRLLHNMKVAMRRQKPDPEGTEFILTVTAHADFRYASHRAQGKVFGVALPHYTRTRIPDSGIQAAHAVKDLADSLIIIDPAHSHFRFIERAVSPDPVLLAVLLHPYKGAPGEKSIGALFAVLCQWK